MASIEKDILETYGHKLRVRVCGVWVEGEEMLVVHHKSMGPNNSLWIPPGGGMEYGESTEEALKREFLEETGIAIQVHEFLFVNEYLNPPFHGLELFFRVSGDRSDLKTGKDPEMEPENQIITEAVFIDFDLLKRQSSKNLHDVLKQINSAEEIFKLKGYFKSH